MLLLLLLLLLLLQGVLTQLLLYVESLVDAAGSVHADAWLYRRHQWAQDLQRLSLQLPVLLPSPGQPQEIPAEAARSIAAAAAPPAAAAAAMRRRVKKLEEDVEETPRVSEGGDAAANALRGGIDPSCASFVTAETPEGTAAAEGTEEAAGICLANGGDKSTREAPPPASPLCSVSSKSIAAAIAAAADAQKAAAAAAAAAAAGNQKEAAADARFAALVRCLCTGFGWEEEPLLQLLEQLYHEAFYTSPAATATAAAAASQGSSSSSSSSSSSAEDLQWVEVRRRLDLIHLWGLYANVWKATGLDCQRLVDLNAPIDR